MSRNILKVMIVDDEEISRKFIMSSLDGEAYNLQIIAEASSVLEALSLLEEETPDIIFTDIYIFNIKKELAALLTML